MSKIMKEIAKLSGTGPLEKGEDDQAYMTRLLEDAGKMGDDEWDKLSPGAQEWINAAQKATNDGAELPIFPDTLKEIKEAVDNMKDEDFDEAGVSGRGSDAPIKPKKKKSSSTKAKDSAPPAKKKPPMTTAKKKSSVPMSMKASSTKKDTSKKEVVKKSSSKPGVIRRAAGAQDFIKQEIMRNPNITREDLHEKVKKKGFKVSSLTVSTLRSGFRNSLKIIRDAGHLKGIDI